MTSLSRKDWILLVLLTLFWGRNWPIMKIGVHNYPPLTFRTLCMIGGLPAIWLILAAMSAVLLKPRLPSPT